jgi:hypothetical protein
VGEIRRITIDGTRYVAFSEDDVLALTAELIARCEMAMSLPTAPARVDERTPAQTREGAEPPSAAPEYGTPSVNGRPAVQANAGSTPAGVPSVSVCAGGGVDVDTQRLDLSSRAESLTGSAGAGSDVRPGRVVQRSPHPTEAGKTPAHQQPSSSAPLHPFRPAKTRGAVAATAAPRTADQGDGDESSLP